MFESFLVVHITTNLKEFTRHSKSSDSRSKIILISIWFSSLLNIFLQFIKTISKTGNSFLFYKLITFFSLKNFLSRFVFKPTGDILQIRFLPSLKHHLLYPLQQYCSQIYNSTSNRETENFFTFFLIILFHL